MAKFVTSKPAKFSWFIEGKLAGMAWPSEESFQFLADNGIKAVINLTEESPPMYEKMATHLGISCIHIRVDCFGPPKMEQVEEVVSIVDRETNVGGRVAIHCAMGCGRTGTMLACYLVNKQGLSADEAIAETRKRRKGSIENRKQEQAVRDYEQHLKKASS